MKIFLIAGKARSGKFEVAKCMKQFYNQNQKKTVITEYSKYIKMFAKEMTDWDGNREKKPRKFLQELGTFIRVNLKQPKFFINRMKEDIMVYEKFFDNIIVADVRFPEELEDIKKHYREVYTFYIINEHGDYDLTIEETNHETERALDNYNDFDYMIVNDNKENLKEKINEILENIERL